MDFNSLTDEQLMVLVAEGEQQALETLYERIARIVFSLAWRMLGSRQIAEEVVQEVFLKVWRGASSFHLERGSVSQWLLSICHHRAVDELRRDGRTPDWNPLDPDSYAGAEEEDHADLLVERDSIRQALESLPGEQKQVIVMAYFQGMTQTEIAEALELPLGTVKTRMRSGLQKLKARLEALGARG